MSEGVRPAAESRCPFCGATARVGQWNIDQGTDWWSVWCDGCGAEGPVHPTRTEAVESWNCRALAGPDGKPLFTRADIAELREAADDADCHAHDRCVYDHEFERVFRATAVTRSVADRLASLLPPEEP
jgi:Lar family restriction alleviation protein